MRLRATRLTAIATAVRRLFNPASLFANNAPGVWYDLSLTDGTLFQDAAGTTPVTAVEQPVGLMLDKSKGLVLGPELVTNGDFSQGTTGWSTSTGASSTAAVVGGEFVVSTSSASGRQVSSIACVPGKTYKVSGSARVSTGTGTALISVSDTTSGLAERGFVATTNITVTTLTFVFTATQVTHYITVGNGSSGVGDKVFDNISVRELPGNHAFQTTSANRSVLSARYNLLTKTEQFDDAAWLKARITVSADVVAAPDGTLTGDKVIESVDNNTHSLYTAGFPLTGENTFSIYAKPAGRNFVVVEADTANTRTYFDISTGIIGTKGSAVIATISPAGGGWYRCSISGAFTGRMYICTGLYNNGYIYPGDGTSGIYIWGADLRVANDGINLPAYQRVNTATDYDINGFPLAASIDGSDDHLVTSSGGGSTTGFFWCGAVRVGKVGATQTLWSDAGTNTGYRVRINAANQLELSAGNGTAYTTVATTDSLTLGQRAVLTAWHDGVNLNVQINNGPVAQTPFAVATAGTAQITIGKDNNAASGYFLGRIYEIVHLKDSVPTAANIAATKTYCAGITKITL